MAAGYAFAEIAGGLLLGFAGGHDRADLAPFVAARPWLFLILMIALANWDARARLGAALLGLATATMGVTAWLALHGDAGLVDGLRAAAAGVVLVGLGEGVIRLAGWAGGGRWLAAALGVGLIALPGGMASYERAALDLAEPAPRDDRPDLMLFSGLPLLWSEGGVAATLEGEPPPAAVTGLAHAFTLHPVAAATPANLGRGGLLLMPQPHIDAAGLVAVDEWVRGGGRVLILTDPDLRWPSRLPPGDPGRPPGAAPLASLLAHWGLTLERDRAAPLAVRTIRHRGADMRVRVGAPGRLASDGRCRTDPSGLIADCLIGRGRALILADADWLLDDLWVGMGSYGTGRYRRTADNGPALIALIDDLRGAPDRQARVPGLWMKSTSPSWLALAVAFAPCLLVLVGGVVVRRRDFHATVFTKFQQTYPQPANRHKGRTMADYRHSED